MIRLSLPFNRDEWPHVGEFCFYRGHYAQVVLVNPAENYFEVGLV